MKNYFIWTGLMWAALAGCEIASNNAISNSGNAGGSVQSESPAQDSTPPVYLSAPVHVAISTSSATTPSIHIEQTATDDTSVVRYEYRVQVDGGDEAIVPWRLVERTDFSVSGLSLISGETYTVCARAMDKAGNASVPACSDGFLVDYESPLITQVASVTTERGASAWADWITVQFSVSDAASGVVALTVSPTLGPQPGITGANWKSLDEIWSYSCTVGTMDACQVLSATVFAYRASVPTANYFSVRAVDAAGLVSVVSFGPVTVPAVP